MKLPIVLGKNLLLQKVEPEPTKSPSGLILPDVKPKQKEYKVIGKGQECPLILIGDVVVCHPYATSNNEVSCNGESFIVVPYDQILAVIGRAHLTPDIIAHVTEQLTVLACECTC